jgi:hypothetical protein
MVFSEDSRVSSFILFFTMLFVFLFTIFWAIYNKNIGRNAENALIYSKCLEIHATMPYSEAKTLCLKLVDRK